MTELIDLGGGTYLAIQHVKHECFAYTVPGYDEPVRWDITRAKEQVVAGHVIGIDRPSPKILQSIADRYEWEEATVATADPKEAGIAAPLIFTERAGGNNSIMYVLIDGTHRAVRALRDQQPFAVAMLTDEASRACLISGPGELIP